MENIRHVHRVKYEDHFAFLPIFTFHPDMKKFNIVVEGCVHGDLNKIYNAISLLNKPIDLVLLCGDFQAIRNPKDLNAMAVPPKYKQMGDFHLYYTGRKTAPYLTIFIGGNHESSSYLRELYYGGWVAPKIYYLGQAGVVNFEGLRIGGLSGIYNKSHYEYNHFEQLPYNSGTERSIYHIRKHDVVSLSLISNGMDIMMSHDWPSGIAYHGDLKDLLRRKPYFKRDIETGELGSPFAFELLKSLRPQHWFSSHLHVRFTAEVDHDIKVNKNEIELDLDELGNNNETSNSSFWKPFGKPLASKTLFLALDKCLPKRQFIEHIQVETEAPSEKRKRDEENSDNSESLLSYDPEWLAIVRVMNKHLDMGPPTKCILPTENELRTQLTQELQWVKEHIVDKGKLPVPDNFKVVAASTTHEQSNRFSQPDPSPNNQTADFCYLLDIDNKIVS